MWIDDRNPEFIVVYQHLPSDPFVKTMHWDTEYQGWVLNRMPESYKVIKGVITITK